MGPAPWTPGSGPLWLPSARWPPFQALITHGLGPSRRGVCSPAARRPHTPGGPPPLTSRPGQGVRKPASRPRRDNETTQDGSFPSPLATTATGQQEEGTQQPCGRGRGCSNTQGPAEAPLHSSLAKLGRVTGSLGTSPPGTCRLHPPFVPAAPSTPLSLLANGIKSPNGTEFRGVPPVPGTRHLAPPPLCTHSRHSARAGGPGLTFHDAGEGGGVERQEDPKLFVQAAHCVIYTPGPQAWREKRGGEGWTSQEGGHPMATLSDQGFRGERAHLHPPPTSSNMVEGGQCFPGNAQPLSPLPSRHHLLQLPAGAWHTPVPARG